MQGALFDAGDVAAADAALGGDLPLGLGRVVIQAIAADDHPALPVIQAGVRAGIPVGLCGEMASDALLIPVLLGFGLERFSVSPSAILNTRREISRWSIQEAQNIADHALTLETAAQVAAYLNQVQER